MNITLYHQNPMINFTKFGLKYQKPQFMHSPKNNPPMHEKMHVKLKINEKERV